MYPLMTQNPKLQKDYLIKITDKKLDRVFDQENKGKFNLDSVYIQDDYISKFNKN